MEAIKTTLRKDNPHYQSGHFFGVDVWDWLMREKADWEEWNVSRRGMKKDEKWS